MSNIECNDTEVLLVDNESSDNYPEETSIIYYDTIKEPKNSLIPCISLVISCVMLFLASCILLITFPIYLEYSKRPKMISSYSKVMTLVTLSTSVIVLLWVAKIVFFKLHYIPKDEKLNVSLPCILKGCLLHSLANMLIIWLDHDKITCHLQDPFFGCASLFALLFYYVFSKKRNSMERIFCTITVIVGVFVTVDYGFCNRFRCRGLELLEHDASSAIPVPWNLLYLALYIISIALYALHFNCWESAWHLTSPKDAHCDLSIISEGTTHFEDVNLTNTTVNNINNNAIIAQSLSVISDHRVSKPTNNLQVKIPLASDRRFPLTSTPKVDENSINFMRHLDICDLLAINYLIFLIVCLAVCWLPTLSIFNSGEPKLLVHVIEEIALSLACHLSRPTSYPPEYCSDLLVPTTILISCSLMLTMFSMVVLKLTQSALLVVVCLMNALPVANIFWSLYELNPSESDLLMFKWEITGEGVSAFLGFPIIGVGTLLLLKSHLRYLALEQKLT